MGGPRAVQDRHRPHPRPRAGERRRRRRSAARRCASRARTSRRRRRSPTPKGRFEFRDLPAGRFTLQAIKSGFVTVQYGQTRPFESGKPIELADKQVLDNADIGMPRGSVIAGRIVDEFGDADSRRVGHGDAPDVAERPAPAACRRRPRRADQRPRPVPHLRPAAGRLLRERHAAQRRARDDGHGVDGGHGGAVSGASGRPASAPKSGYASTYYPGTPNVAEAQRITVAAGQESPSADFALAAGAAREGHRDRDRLGRQAARRRRRSSPCPRNREFGGLMLGQQRADRQGRQLHAQQRARRATTRCRRDRFRSSPARRATT